MIDFVKHIFSTFSQFQQIIFRIPGSLVIFAAMLSKPLKFWKFARGATRCHAADGRRRFSSVLKPALKPPPAGYLPVPTAPDVHYRFAAELPGDISEEWRQ